MAQWIQKARESMERRGTVGKFGRTTARKVARAKARGGVEKKRAVFAQNMKRLATKRKRKRQHLRSHHRTNSRTASRS
jgi:hypothetical protein